MFLYISFLYTIYLTGLLILPWKIIVISKKNSSLFTVINFSSFVVFSIVQFHSLYFHQSQIDLSIFSDSYLIITIQIVILLFIQLLFRWFFKLYHPIQKSKNLKEEWKRLSSYSLYWHSAYSFESFSDFITNYTAVERLMTKEYRYLNNSACLRLLISVFQCCYRIL